MRAGLSLLMFAMTAYTGVAAAQTWSPEQQEIWRLEEQQWRMAAAKDLSWIETMVHPNLNFWQSDQPMPRAGHPSPVGHGTTRRIARSANRNYSRSP